MTLPRLSMLVTVVSTASLWCCGGPEAPLTEKKQPLSVEANPPGHMFEGKTFVELTASRPAEIYYTLSGADPIGTDAIHYDGPIEVEQSTLITFVAGSEDGIWSAPEAELYTPTPDTPEPELKARALAVDQTSHFFSATPGSSERMEATFTIRSVGLDRVNISRIYIGVNEKGWGFFEDGVFTIVGANDEAFDLPPGREHTITVSYVPTTTLRSAVVAIESDEQRSSDGYVLIELWGRVINW